MSTEENIMQIKGLDKIMNLYNEKKQVVLGAGVALIVIALGIFYYSNYYLPGQEDKAAADMMQAERYFASDSAQKALYGDGINLGLVDIADQYGSTKAGKRAHLMAGRLLLDLGEYEAAKEHLSKVDIEDFFFSSAAVILMGDCYSELGDYEKAGRTYMKASKIVPNTVTTPKALYKAAIAFEAAGELEKSMEALTDLRAEYFNTPEAESVERYLAKLQAMINAQD